MFKKFFVNLISRKESNNYLGRRKEINLSEQRFHERSAEESRLAEERHRQIMDSRKHRYVSERSVPSEAEVLGPSDSAVEKKE